MSLRSPLGTARGLGAAGDAVHHWWVQRLTSLALILLCSWLLASLLTLPSLDFITVTEWISGSWTASLLVLLVLTASWHSQLGIQVVIEDYVHEPGTKTLSLVLCLFVHIVIAAAGSFAVLRIACGSPL